MHLGRTNGKDPSQPALGEILTVLHPENSSFSKKERQTGTETKTATHDSSEFWHSLLRGRVGTKPDLKIDHLWKDLMVTCSGCKRWDSKTPSASIFRIRPLSEGSCGKDISWKSI